ncbi:hypothetical protein SPSIL_058080 [Sporomusa silvacetica DSM 10669]|uniref:Helix-turn-helix domain-containing protein n=1 Tax=Sporomusa silvacetica DSM 10669 TaxID=1123289 RepID=A0ABZ3IV49_9FIRM|nr:helix-turn-helix domain-containing protein [Sporomusa silvacetica]OZC14244.1 hypothetical protein SPSIL_49710 [Sporomusa silvacetica DSM 10669]
MQLPTANIPIPDSTATDELTFLSATEVADIFFQGKLKYARVLQMTRNGELPAMKQGKSYLYLWSALEKWAEKNFNKPNWAHKSVAKRM